MVLVGQVQVRWEESWSRFTHRSALREVIGCKQRLGQFCQWCRSHGLLLSHEMVEGFGFGKSCGTHW